eukprot:TRINITY_DN41_c0_g1_i1.p1 TRINITY_DN41_c0_g1~~TRINITY_DN41_c0_g1_i1.p1  ORF type:complete len:137 (+),score=26.95 TRINITY_DN41_c0_g1_i1:93-503(+)
MPKFLKPGKVVIVLNGRYAGRKAVIVQTTDKSPETKTKFSSAIIAGVDRAPKRVIRKMSKKTIEKRSRIKPFIKKINYSHIMPTRYTLTDIDLKKIVSEDSLQAANRKAVKTQLKTEFQSKYVAGKNRWFFTKLRF